jgi:hypothetical protein
MDAKRVSDRLKRFFIVKCLAPCRGLREPIRQAEVFIARKLIENTMASLTLGKVYCKADSQYRPIEVGGGLRRQLPVMS